MATQPVLAYALDYAQRGWHIFPIQPLTKDPLKGSKGFYDATQDESRIAAFPWREDHNLAIRTGSESGLVVLDVDEKDQGYESLRKLAEEGALSPEDLCTYRVKTPSGGEHLYFLHPRNGHIGLRVKFRPGLDIRADGGYVLAPPSDLPQGEYLAVDHEAPLRPLPDSLLAIIAVKAPTPSQLLAVNEAGEANIMEGGRNNYLTKLAGALQRRGLSVEAVQAALHAENDSRCIPPLPSREVDNIALWVTKYEATNPVPVEEKTEHFIRASDLAQPMLTFLRDKARVKGKPTGMLGLDKLLGGGKRLGELTAWHAEAKTGKNTLWHKLMYLWLTLASPVPIGYASRELTPAEEVLPNLLSLQYRKNVWLSDIDEKTAYDYSETLKSWPIYFSEGYGVFPVNDILQWVGDLQQLGVEYFFIDHLHYCLEDPEDHKAASKLIKELKTLAKARNIHIDLIIQPNKLLDGQSLSKNTIKGGAAMGQAIDNLIILERNKDQPSIMNLKLDIARSKLAKPGRVQLEYDSDTTDFIEVEAVREVLPVDAGGNGNNFKRKGPYNFGDKKPLPYDSDCV